MPSYELYIAFKRGLDKANESALKLPRGEQSIVTHQEEVQKLVEEAKKNSAQSTLNVLKEKRPLPIPWVVVSYMAFRAGTLGREVSYEDLTDLVELELSYLCSVEQSLVDGATLNKLRKNVEQSRLIKRVMELIPNFKTSKPDDQPGSSRMENFESSGIIDVLNLDSDTDSDLGDDQ